MARLSKLLLMAFVFLIAAVPMASARSMAPSAETNEDEGIMVGRISHIDGELLRYVPEEKDWVATVKDAPFGLDDALYSEENAKAEFIMPNGTWIRIDGVTQIQLIALKEEVTEVDVASGVARFYNKGAGTVMKVTTPFGYVYAPAGTIFDLYVGDNSAEVISLKGTVDFVHEGDEARYDVSAGSSSIIADSRNVSSGDGNVNAEWDDWNDQRDSIWRKRAEVKGDSVRYLPQGLRDEAHTLEDNGRWERVYYDGGYRNYWRPARVSVGWTPFSVGRWSVYYGDNCWIPDEPFGYVTHHYGNWVNVDNGWYWAPPVARVRVNVAPSVGIGFGWYPGRVAWIHTNADIGWIPLAPTEIYYGHRPWGRHAVVINEVNFNTVNINVSRYRYVDRAIIVNQNNFYRVNNYQNVRITNINKTTIINNYRGAPVVNNKVINNYNNIRERYNFSDARVSRKPHQTVLGRIESNQANYQKATRVNARSIEQDIEQKRPRKAERLEQVEAPKATKRLVNADAVGKPKSDVQFEQRELKGNQRKRRDTAEDPSQGRDDVRTRPAKAR